MILDATAPHTRVDNFVIDEYGDKIGAVGLAVYMVIKRHYNWITGQCSPSYNRIAEICGINRSTVVRYVKRLKSFGLISPSMRFTDEGQTSNQYAFYQPERPKPVPDPAQKSSPAQLSPPVAESNPPSRTEPPDQVVLNKKEKEAKTVPPEKEKTQETEKPVVWNDPVTARPSEKTAPMGKQKTCPHPFAEVVTLFDGITICNHCYNLLNYEPDAEPA